MNLLAAVLLAAASARIEAVSLTAVDARLAVRVTVSGTPGLVAVHREGDVARVSITDADLGLRFAGGRRFSWTPSDGFDPALVAATPVKLDRIEIAASSSEVSVLLHVPPEVSVDVRRDARGLLVLFRQAPAAATAPERVAEATPPPAPVAPPPVAAPPPAPAPLPVAPPVVEATAVAPAPAAPAPAPAAAEPAVVPPPSEPVAVARAEPEPAAAVPAAADTAALARQLFPAAETPATGGAVADLYPRLFPTGAPQNLPEEAPVIESVEPGQQAGLPVGPFRVRAAVDARYVDADTFVEESAVATRDRYLEVQPRVEAVTPVGEGQFAVDYAPVFRAFATYDQVNSSSHDLGARLQLQVGPRVNLRARDRFRSGVLDTRVVDPGGEYFFGLGRFHRNDADLGASIMVGPRLSLELGGAIGAVRFQEESTFFDYDTRRAEAGLGYEISPSLKAVASYAYDTVPRPDDRPEAESTAHSALLTLSGEITPLLNGDVTVGYRSQDSPSAAEGGTGYSGLTLSAALSRQIGRESTVAVYASRFTPVSAYEQNAFYVSTALQGTVRLPLPARFELRGGLGYQWNDYRTVASAIGVPREDEILGWYVGLRRPLWENVFLSGAYRSEDRSSNVNEFDTDADGFYFQLEWDIFGNPSR
jgi:hypothetical protein